MSKNKPKKIIVKNLIKKSKKKKENETEITNQLRQKNFNSIVGFLAHYSILYNRHQALIFFLSRNLK